MATDEEARAAQAEAATRIQAGFRGKAMSRPAPPRPPAECSPGSHPVVGFLGHLGLPSWGGA